MADIELKISAKNPAKMKMTGVSLKGDPGYTPQRGTDYWTEEDKAEVIEEATKAAAKEVQEMGTELSKKLDAVEGITPFVFDITLSDDLTEVTTETTYADIQEAYEAGKQIYIQVSHMGFTYSAPLSIVGGIRYSFELFVNGYHVYVICDFDTESENPERWYVEAVDIVTQAEINNYASRVRIDELEGSKEIRVYAPDDLANDNGIYQAIELYDKEQVDAKIGDIDTALENIIAKYGLGGDGV